MRLQGSGSFQSAQPPPRPCFVHPAGQQGWASTHVSNKHVKQQCDLQPELTDLCHAEPRAAATDLLLELRSAVSQRWHRDGMRRSQLTTPMHRVNWKQAISNKVHFQIKRIGGNDTICHSSSYFSSEFAIFNQEESRYFYSNFFLH